MENKIEVADALAIKLHRRFNYLVSTMKTTSHHLSEGNLPYFFPCLFKSLVHNLNHSNFSSYNYHIMNENFLLLATN